MLIKRKRYIIMRDKKTFDNNTRKKCRMLMKEFLDSRNNNNIVYEACENIMSIHHDVKIKDLDSKIGTINKKINELKRNNKMKRINMTKNDNVLDRFKLKIPDRSFMNLTELVIPKNVQTYIALGPKFIPPMEIVPVSELILNIIQIEDICIDNGIIQNINFKKNLCDKISKNMNGNLNYMEKYILRIKKEYENFMKENENYIIVQTDKGNISTFMEKKVYYEKMDNLINKGIKEKTYVKINRDSEYIHKYMLYLRDIRLSKWIDIVGEIKQREFKDLIRNVKNKNVCLPKFYGNIKVHKVDKPMRPIMSTVNSYSRVLTEYIKDTLKYIVFDYDINTINSIEAYREIKDLKVIKGYCFMKLDIVNMFTNIPVREVLRIIEIFYRTKIEPYTKVPYDIYYQLLTYIFRDDMYFKYRDNIYKQLKGLPMGSCISQIAAKIYVDYKLNENKELITN